MPDYWYCADQGDATQLTDGARTEEDFWGRKSTVVRYGNRPSFVVVDLGKRDAVCGHAWSCAAGTAGVL